MRRSVVGLLFGTNPGAARHYDHPINTVEQWLEDIALLVVCISLCAFDSVRSAISVVAPAILFLSASRTLGGWGSLHIGTGPRAQYAAREAGGEDAPGASEAEDGKCSEDEEKRQRVLEELVLRRNASKLLRLPVHRDVLLAPAFLYAVRHRWTEEVTLVLMWLLLGSHDTVGRFTAIAAPLLLLLNVFHALFRRPSAHQPLPKEVLGHAAQNTGSAQARAGGQGGAEDTERVVRLYEQYIKLPPLRAKWGSPVTAQPVLEPPFVAAMHAVELGFLLLEDFIGDKRDYVVLQHRIEQVARDIGTQMGLIADIVDGGLKLPEASSDGGGTLTQPTPFAGGPPVRAPSEGGGGGRQSAGLERLLRAVESAYPTLGEADKISLRGVVRVVSGAFATAFGGWTVGVGCEGQLGDLRAMVGLDGGTPHEGPFLDYQGMVAPHLCETTVLTQEEREEHVEDFFFRTVHLGTECWAFAALSRLSVARRDALCGRWRNAAAHLRTVARVLEYLGSHVMMLSSMCLSDYLPLKVEIEGTSGAGSLQVKELRRALSAMLAPLSHAAIAQCPRAGPGASSTEHKPLLPSKGSFRKSKRSLRVLIADTDASDDGFGPAPPGGAAGGEEAFWALLRVYSEPEASPELHTYAKALEGAESALLGRFFHSHYVLACGVIGSAARGTMNREVGGLRATFGVPVFPILDQVRSRLGQHTDLRLGANKGKILKHLESTPPPAPPSASGGLSSTWKRGAPPTASTTSTQPLSTPPPSPPPPPPRGGAVARGG